MTKNRTTQKDIARALGLSDMTVSRVLTGRGTVSQRTRTKVLKAVEEVGYVKNRMAGTLSVSRSNQVGVILPSMRVGIFPEVLDGITQELEKAQYNPVVGITDYDIQREESLVESLLSWNAAGIIVNDFVHTERTVKLLKAADIPVVEIMQVSGTPIKQCVGFDHSAAGAALAHHLVAKGYKNFAYLGWHGNEYAASVRFSGVRDYLVNRGYPLIAPDLFDSPPSIEDGSTGLVEILNRATHVDAIIFGNDLMCVGAYFKCQELGLSIPTDIAFAGFGGLEFGQALPQKLTTIEFPRLVVGQRAARTILNAMASDNGEEILDLNFTLIPGETT